MWKGLLRKALQRKLQTFEVDSLKQCRPTQRDTKNLRKETNGQRFRRTDTYAHTSWKLGAKTSSYLLARITNQFQKKKVSNTCRTTKDYD